MEGIGRGTLEGTGEPFGRVEGDGSGICEGWFSDGVEVGLAGTAVGCAGGGLIRLRSAVGSGEGLAGGEGD